ncbi:glycosyltransferase family 9 protein [Mucilaginibacter sp. BJC16-A38]|uniref:glycosyltransferase family 9 protein n=1 Tax=Mucilaginibacter phenanthrenivorans TaxID=1234842 RepID=UPI0021583EA4|nr:glycosyltransferase family 9 protein [Mucilaginibacter phenanthrenivorans]MCR8559838.1 glycosyltransferase family 9 protein [Mucilaginibacter phenanthrenivorans]
MPAPKHILAIRLSAMGDVAMTVPVIKAVLKQNPELIITFISRPEFAGFFNDIPRLSYFSVDLNNEYKGLKGIVKLFRTLNKNTQYDALADLHDNLRTKILRKLFRLSGLPYAYVDKGRPEKKLLTRFPGKVLKPLKLTTERYADVFIDLGFNAHLDHQLVKHPQLLTTEILAISGEKTKPWIGIAPFAKHKGKIYPLERTEEVIKLLDNRNVNIFLFGGSVLEQEICEQWQEKYVSVISLVRKTTMEQELAIISRLDVMMSMDSAGMHLASLEGIPVVSVWGATHHYAGFLGYGQSEGDIVADDIECRPCSIYGNKPCFRKDYACLYNIQPETIVAAIDKHIR